MGRCLDYNLAMQGALKIKEISYIHAVALAYIFKMIIKDILLRIFIGNAKAGAFILIVYMYVAEG